MVATGARAFTCQAKHTPWSFSTQACSVTPSLQSCVLPTHGHARPARHHMLQCTVCGERSADRTVGSRVLHLPLALSAQRYRGMLEAFATRIAPATVTLYRLPGSNQNSKPHSALLCKQPTSPAKAASHAAHPSTHQAMWSVTRTTADQQFKRCSLSLRQQHAR